jgi:transposase
VRQGIVYSGGKAWTGAHDSWPRAIGRDGSAGPAAQVTFESEYEAVLSVEARRDRLETEIATMAADSESTTVVLRLGCLRGVATLTGFASAVEIGDWHRFTGSTIGSSWG